MARETNGARAGGLVPIVPRDGGGGLPAVRAADSMEQFSLEELGAYLHGELLGSAGGVAVTPASSMRVSTVYACVRILSQTFGSLPCRLRRQVDDSSFIVDDNPLDRVLHRQANHWQTAYEFRQMAMGHLALRGNAYALIVRNATGDVQALVPLHPDRVQPKQRDDLLLEYDWHAPTGGRRTLPASEILHLRGLTMDGVKGISPIQAARNSIALGIQGERQGLAWFQGGTNPGGVLTSAKPLSGPRKKELEDQIADLYSSAGKAGRTMILSDGMEWNKVGMTAGEAEWIEGRKFQRSDLAMFWGIPPHMLGDVDKNTSWGSGIESQGIGFVTYTMLPWLVSAEQAFDRDLLTPAQKRDQWFTKFTVQALLRGDFKTRQEGLAIMRRNGVINADEWRRLEDMNPIADGGGQQYIIEANMSAETPNNDGSADNA